MEVGAVSQHRKSTPTHARTRKLADVPNRLSPLEVLKIIAAAPSAFPYSEKKQDKKNSMATCCFPPPKREKKKKGLGSASLSCCLRFVGRKP